MRDGDYTEVRERSLASSRFARVALSCGLRCGDRVDASAATAAGRAVASFASTAYPSATFGPAGLDKSVNTASRTVRHRANTSGLPTACTAD